MFRFRMGINAKMILLILTLTTIIYAFSVAYISSSMRNMSLRNAKVIVNSFGKEYANLVMKELNSSMDISRAMTQAFQALRYMPYEQREEVYLHILEKVALDNPEFNSIWLSKELADVDSNWVKEHGRIRYTYYRDSKGELHPTIEVIDTIMDKLNTNGSYYLMKASIKEEMVNPYIFGYEDDTVNLALMSSACIPLKHEGKFTGLAGVDILLGKYEDIINKIDVYTDEDGQSHGYAFLLSNDGSFVTHPIKENIGKRFNEIDTAINEQNNVIEKIEQGKDFSFDFYDDVNNQKSFMKFTPIRIGNSPKLWSLGIVLSYDDILRESNTKFRNVVAIAIICLLMLAAVVYYIAGRISKPIAKTTKVLRSLAIGDINHANKLDVKSKDEIGDMADSVNIMIDGLNRTAKFSEQIGKGNLEASFEPLSESDVLGNSLLKMRESLKKAKTDEDIRRKDDERRNWATQGLARFADLLRQNNDDIEKLSFEIVYNMVKYIDAKVGGIYILNQEDEEHHFLEMKACFAYDRKKKLEKTIEIGEGLIGACFKERKTMHLKKIPEGYLSIVSGLGESQPKAIINVPLIYNEEILGVIELAALEPFDEFEIEFVEKVGESIAATISTVKVNMRTSELLQQSRLQSEQLRAQDEEMRQNMEELSATQEEMARKNAEMEGVIGAINKSNFVIYYDLNGYIIDFNDAYLKRFKIKDKSEFIGSHHSDNMNLDEKHKMEYDKFWEDLRSGKMKRDISKLTVGKNDYWFEETYSPIKDNNGKTYKIMKIANDITNSKTSEIEFDKKLKELKAKMEELHQENLDLKGKVRDFNSQIDKKQSKKGKQ